MKGRAGRGRGRIVRVLVVAGAAMLLNGEYFKYGPALLVQILLFGFYIAYATTAEALARALKWSLREVALLGVAFGLVMEGFFTRSFYQDPPRILGVNWLSVAVQGVYWGVLASALAFWIGDRIAPRRDDRPLFGWPGWAALAVGWTGLLGLWASQLPPLREPGAVPIGVLAAVMTGILAARSIGTSRAAVWEHAPSRKSRFVIAAVVMYLVLELLAGTAGWVVSLVTGAAGVSPPVLWTWIVAGLVLGGATAYVVLGGEKHPAVAPPAGGVGVLDSGDATRGEGGCP